MELTQDDVEYHTGAAGSAPAKEALR
jgi:hypothetical protein